MPRQEVRTDGIIQVQGPVVRLSLMKCRLISNNLLLCSHLSATVILTIE